MVEFLVVAKEGVGAHAGSALGLFLAGCLGQVSPGPIRLNAETGVINQKTTKMGSGGHVASSSSLKVFHESKSK